MKKADYKYNIRGWLTGINDISNLQQISGPNDLFAFKINYTQTHQNYGSEVTPLYNGNIAETLWRSGSDNILRSYGYAYDPMNRLTNAIYGRPNSGVKLTHNYNEWLTYDANGNILTLGRNGISDSHNNLILIDNLDYHYKDGNSNILVSVDDLSDNDAGFKKGNTTQEDDFEYDANGNLIIDRNKDITQITYNHLNLPVKIVFDNNSNKYIEYLYTATGQKTQKRVKHLDSTSITKYLHGFQYYDGVLQFFHTPEGYVKNTPHDNGTPSFDYVYQYRDHLGNVRINYAQDPQTGDLAILDENHYYPFGLRHTNYNSDRLDIKRIENQEKGLVDENPPHLPVANRGYQYKFNGKELQSEFGINIYDFGFRNYDPALGRWMNIDPMAEKMRRHSPYNYAFNNPIFWIDPDGMAPQVHVIGSDSKGGVDLTGAMHDVNASVARNRAECGTPSNPCPEITTNIDGKDVTFQQMRVYVNKVTVFPTGNGNYGAYTYVGTENGSYYAMRVKSDSPEHNNYFGPNEHEYTVFESADSDPKIISTQTERSYTVPGLIRDTYNPFNENLARGMENAGSAVSLGGDAGVVGSTAAGYAAWPFAVISGIGLSMEVRANQIRNQSKERNVKLTKEAASQAGTQIVNKKTKSNYIKATYEAAAALLKKLF